MKKLIVLIIALNFIFNVFAQNNISGDWLLTHVDVKGESKDIYQAISFKENGRIAVMGVEFGSWSYDKKKKQLIMNVSMDKDMNGIHKIVSLKGNEMLAEKNGVTYFYKKINTEDIEKNNSTAHIQGVWKTKNGYDETTYLRFIQPDKYVEFQYISGGGKSVSRGTWMYLPKENSFIVMAHSEFFKGKNKLVKQSADKIEFKNKEQTYTATKIPANTVKIEKLNFTEDDLEDAENTELPAKWNDFYEKTDFLSHIKKLSYRKGNFIKSLDIFLYSTFGLGIDSDGEETVKLSFIDEENIGDEIHFDESADNKFFPLEECMSYRLAGTEKISTPAGSFECTLIEAMSDFDEKIKLWLINDKPGIYARIISQKKSFDDEEEYTFIELTKIE